MQRNKNFSETSTTSMLLSWLPSEQLTELPELVSNTNEQSLWSKLSQTAGWFNPFKGKSASAATARLAATYAALSSIVPAVAACDCDKKCFTLPLAGTSAPCDFYELTCDVPRLAEQAYQAMAAQCGAYYFNQSISTPYGKIEQICPGDISSMSRIYLNLACQPIAGNPAIPPHVEHFGHSYYGYSVCDLSYLFDKANACVVDVMNNMTQAEIYTNQDRTRDFVKFIGIGVGGAAAVIAVAVGSTLALRFFRSRAAQKALSEESPLQDRNALAVNYTSRQ